MAIHAPPQENKQNKMVPNSKNKLAYTYQMALLKLCHINDLYCCSSYF